MPPDRLSRRQHLLLALLLPFALVLRLVYLWGQARHNPLFNDPMMDALTYHELAQRIASGQGFGPAPYFLPPLFYYLLGALYRLAGPSLAAAKIMGCLLGAASCYLIGRLGAILSGFRTAVLAGLLAALYWPFIYFDAELLTAALEVFLNTLFLLLLLAAVHRRARSLFLAAGLVLGLSALTRPNILAFAPFLCLWFLLAAPPGQRIRRSLRAAALTLGGALLIILPVTCRNMLAGGERVLISTNGGVNFFIGNNRRSDGIWSAIPGARKGRRQTFEDSHRIAAWQSGRKLSYSEASAYWYARSFRWIRSSPVHWARLMVRKCRLFWSPVELNNNQAILQAARRSGVSKIFLLGFPAVVCLGMGGLVFIRDRWRLWLLPLTFLMVYMATVIAFFCIARFRLPIVPVLILLSAHGLVHLWRRIRAGRVKGILIYLLAVCAMGIFLYSNPPERRAYRSISEAGWHRTLGLHYAKALPDKPPDFERSARHYARAAEILPWHVESRLGEARAMIGLGRLDEAESRLAAVVRAHPDHANARMHYAGLLVKIEKPEAAIKQYRAAAALQPTLAEAHAQLGCLLVRAGRIDEALIPLRRALSIQPGLRQARICLNRALGRQASP
jgi:4-amino-4-deoxy-L-arabinose transferase-like glycosyltransferase